MPSEPQRLDDAALKVVQFHIMNNLTDPQPTIVLRERSTDPFCSFVSFACQRKSITIQSCEKFFGTSAGSTLRDASYSHRTLTFTTIFLHRRMRTGVNSTLRRLRKIGTPITPNRSMFSPIPLVGYSSNSAAIHRHLTTSGTRTRPSFSKVSDLHCFDFAL